MSELVSQQLNIDLQNTAKDLFVMKLREATL